MRSRAAACRPALIEARTRGEPMKMLLRGAVPVFLRAAMVASISSLIASVPAVADTVAEFYANTPVKIIIRSEAGGTYDVYSRILSRHMNKYIPGRPAM